MHIDSIRECKRIRRKLERKSFTRVVITESKNKTEKYGTYWVGDKNISDYYSFPLKKSWRQTGLSMSNFWLLTSVLFIGIGVGIRIGKDLNSKDKVKGFQNE